MDTNYHAHQTPQFRVLSDRQIEKLVDAALHILQATGIDLQHAGARDLLAGAGAQVDGARVRIPSHIVERAVLAAPPIFSLWRRDGTRAFAVGPDRVTFGPGPTCTHVLDPRTGERRLARRGDPADVARVVDALPNLDYAMGLGLISDVPPDLAPLHEFAEMVRNTIKPILIWSFSVDVLDDIHQIALSVAGDEAALRRRPFFAVFATYQSPLVQAEEDVAHMLWAAEHGLPLTVIGGPSAGATGPITGAGTLAVCLAGMLSTLVIAQLKRPGTPVCVGGVPQPTDLRSGRPSYGGPEASLYTAALADVSRWLRVPFLGTAGASDAKTIDLQAAIESTTQVIFSCLSGASLIHDVGFLDCADIGSLEMLVMTDEIISLAKRLMRGIEISDETLMLDHIEAVGPGGEYLSTDETARLCRTEIWTSDLMDRQPWVNWQAAGAPTMHRRIKDRLRRILDEHITPPLPPDVDAAIDRILRSAMERSGGQPAGPAS
jgi:trimethylamine--corrinoid protein Co-methyltransferase